MDDQGGEAPRRSRPSAAANSRPLTHERALNRGSLTPECAAQPNARVGRPAARRDATLPGLRLRAQGADDDPRLRLRLHLPLAAVAARHGLELLDRQLDELANLLLLMLFHGRLQSTRDAPSS